jgi:glycosyltransferase involved in cell wall biosynthesis
MGEALSKTPTISAIIPAYNSASFISEALDSVFAQTFANIEVIVVNDGSQDGPELEKALAPYIEKIVYVRQENRGLSGARNAGIRLARGKYLAFLDSDDLWPPEYLTAQLQMFIEDPALGLAYADAMLFGSEIPPRRTFMQTSSPPTTLEGLLTEGGQILPSGTVVRKDAIVEAGLFDESLRRCEDYDMWLRLAQRGLKMAYQSKVSFRRRVHGGALTSDENKMVSSLIRVLTKLKEGGGLSNEAQELVAKQLSRAKAELGLMEGKNYLIAGDAKSAREALSTAYGFFRSKKIALTLLGLRIAPGATMWGARRLMKHGG